MWCKSCGMRTTGRPPKFHKKLRKWIDFCGNQNCVQHKVPVEVFPVKPIETPKGNRCPRCGLLLSVGGGNFKVTLTRIDRGTEFHIFNDCPVCHTLIYD